MMIPENNEIEDLMDGLVLYTADGERIGRIGKIQDLPEITVAAGKETAPVMFPKLEEFYEIKIKLPKDWHCQSRKRFIKLLMSKEISRNEAESVARVARIAGVPYRKLWQMWFFWG